MAERRASLLKQYSNRPSNTLTYVENDEAQMKMCVEKERKTEKSVRFAEADSTSHDQSVAVFPLATKDMLTWLLPEHVYNDDTFISADSQTETIEQGSGDGVTTIYTEPSCGSSTFIYLDSKDETYTASDYSYTDSFLSSGVFSSHSDTLTQREWKDVTEIVKDIEELEESEFVADALYLSLDKDEKDNTDFTESEDEEMTKEDFFVNTICRLKLQDLQSPRSLPIKCQFDSEESPRVLGFKEREKDEFCKRMIAACRKGGKSQEVRTLNTCEQAQRSERKVIEHYGLSSAVLDMLKLQNLQHELEKKALDIDKDTEKSLAFVQNNQAVEAEFHKEQFISQMRANIQKDNIDELIQSHLIKMHPVKWFSDFVKELPEFGEDSWEILYKYKRQAENRKLAENG